MSKGTLFYSNMSGGFHHRNRHGNWKGLNSGRGGTPQAPPPPYMGLPPLNGPPAWGQSPWLGMPYYPPYMPMPGPSMPRMFTPEGYFSGLSHVPDSFMPPSPPKGPCTDYSKSGQKWHHFETEQEDARCKVHRECSPLPMHEQSKVGADRVAHRSPSPDIKEAFKVEDEVEMELPVLIDVPMLGGPLAFTLEVLRNLGQAHLDHSEQTIQYHTQLNEWKHTKQDLHTILGKAYEEMQVLKEHIISNDVTQEHLYALHIQVKCSAMWVRDVTHNVGQLIGIALKQMTLNVEAVHNFGTILCAIPYNTLEIQDFYHSIRSFYIGLLE